MAKQDMLRRAQRDKYEQERAILLASGTSEWVPLLLRSTRAAAKNRAAAAFEGEGEDTEDSLGGASADAAFVARVDALEASRKAAAEGLREHSAFVAVLQSALAKEASIFLQKEAARGADTSGGGKPDFADDMGSKVLMEQILLKMKNLREELSKEPALKEAVLRPLTEMAEAAAVHVGVPRAALAAQGGGGGEAEEERERLELQASDVELIAQQAGREGARVRQGVEASRALEPLKRMAAVVRGGVETELAQVEARMAEGENDEMQRGGNDEIPRGADEARRAEMDESQRAGLEKRAAVLQKELHVLRDILARDELAKVLHGLSQVQDPLPSLTPRPRSRP
jgi:NACalpha-BTF3-like transcription factor